MAEFSKFVHVDLNAGVRNVPVEGGFFRRDALANRLGVIVSKDHEPVTLTGIIKGFVKYPPHDPPATGTDVTIYSFNGTIDPEDPSKAYIDLPAEAYYYNGTITVAIRNDVGDKKTVLATFTGYVSDSTDGTEGVPPHSLPDDIDQFISYLSRLENDIANVQTAAAQATRVNITQSKTDRVITVQTIGRTASEDCTTTITEPTATISKEENGPYHLTVTDVNGTTQAEIPDPAAEVKKKANRSSVTSVKTAHSDDGTVTVDDALDEPAKLTLNLEPKQDLHGYNRPWVGGAGKNLLRMILTEIKAANSGWSWNGNTATRNGVSIAVQTDADGNVLGYNVSGTASDSAWFVFRRFGNNEILVDGSLKFGGYLSEDGNVSTKFGYQLYFNNNNGNNVIWVSKSGYSTIRNSITEGDTGANYASFVIRPGATVSNLIIQPMILLSGETDYTFEPYSNICPIEGYDTVRITSTGKNLLPCTLDNKTVNNVVFKKLSDGSYLLDGVASANIGAERFYIGDGYFLKPNTKYILSGSPDGGSSSTYRLMAGFNDATITFTDTGNGVAFTTPSSWTNFMVYPIVLKDQNMSEKVFAPMIRLATEEDSNYEPFGSTTSLSVSQAAGATVYGGTITLNEDGSGILVVDRAFMTLDGNANIQYSSKANGLIVMTTNDENAINVNNAIICNRLKTMNASSTSSTTEGVPLVGLRTSSVRGCLLVLREDWLSDTSTQTASVNSAKEWLASNPLDICYCLSTAVSYPLTAAQIQTLLGTNHVWTDSGCEFTLDYRTDKYGKLDEVYSAFPEASAGPADVVTITDGADDIPVKSLSVAIEPKQDLHGYMHPWVGGAGKNLLNSTIAKIRERNVHGTWNGDVYSDNGVAFTINSKDGISIDSVSVNGQASADTFFRLDETRRDLPSESLIASGGPSGAAISTCLFTDIYSGKFRTSGSDDSPFTTGGSTIEPAIKVVSGYSASNLVFKPMIRLATETDPTYEPYSNICPISGWDTVNVTRCGKNLADFVQNMGIQQDGTVAAHNGRIATVNPIPIRSGSSYRFVAGTTGVLGVLSVFKGDTLVRRIANIYTNTILDTSGGDRFYFCCYDTPQMTIETAKAMIVDSSEVDASYEPYHFTTLPISLSRAGTVYGGTLDVGTGVMTVDRAVNTLNGSENWALAENNLVQYLPISVALPGVDRTHYEKVIGSGFKMVATKHSSLMKIGTACFNGTSLNFMLKIGFDSVDSIKTYLAANPMQVAYPLATPITYQLSPHELTTLLGTNHIWSDAGQVTVEYRADPTAVINSLIKRIETLEERT